MTENMLMVFRSTAFFKEMKEAFASRYTVHHEESSDAAIEAFENVMPGIVVLEDFIKGNGGIELCRYLKERVNDIPVVLLIHREIMDYEDARIRSGADYVFSYPGNKQEMKNLVSHHLFGCENYQKENDTVARGVYGDAEKEGDLYVQERSGELLPFSGYSLLRKIAEGGMADIYLALKQGISGFRKLVVVKRINKMFSKSQDFVTRFMDEAKICAHLNHKNIVQVYDHGSYQGQLFIAMEYIEGENLAQIMRKANGVSLPESLVLYISQEICYGLSYAHSARDDKRNALHIIHRDISPHNILISVQGEVKIADFGVAKATISHRNTAAKVLVGKLFYMSPDQINGAASQETDIFSVGVIMYEMLTGQHPYISEQESFSPLEMIKALNRHEYRIIGGKNERLQELEKIIIKALGHNEQIRYTSSDELLLDLLALPWAASQKMLKDFLQQFNIAPNVR